MMLSDDVREMAEVMLWQLESNRLRVSLAPAHSCPRRKIRVVDELNPEWYSRFCAEYANSNRSRSRPRRRQVHDTYIKRNHTLRALRELAGGSVGTVYAQRLLPYVVKELLSIGY